MLTPVELLKRIPKGTIIAITSKTVPGTRRARPAKEVVRFEELSFNEKFKESLQQYQIDATQAQFVKDKNGNLTEKQAKMRFYINNIETITVI